MPRKDGILPENELFKKYTATHEDTLMLLRCMRYHYADDRLRAAIAAFPEIVDERHEDMGGLLSLRRETVTRTLKVLRKNR